jgi:hypothetical protein
MFTKTTTFFVRFGAAMRASHAIESGRKPYASDLRLLGIPTDSIG